MPFQILASEKASFRLHRSGVSCTARAVRARRQAKGVARRAVHPRLARQVTPHIPHPQTQYASRCVAQKERRR